MMVPLYARYIAAAVGLFLVVIDSISLVGTLIVPRPAGGRLMIWVDRLVHAGFQLLTAPVRNYHRRDRILAAEAATLLICQLLAWLAVAYVGFTLLLWPFIPGGVTLSFDDAGPAFWFIGDSSVTGAAGRVIQGAAGLIGLTTLTLQIAYLPTLYSAFNRRETDVALLNARAGVPSWGPELLARTHYALGSGASTINTLPDLYDQWERWAADIAESHTTYLPLVRFRSPKPLSSWVTALLAVLDSAAMYLALSPEAAPTVAARLCLRGGFQCFNEVARAMGLAVPEMPDPERGHQPDLPGVPGRDRDAGKGELPGRAHARRRLAGLRRLAGQLRAGRLRGGQGRRRGPGALVRPAAPPAEDRSRPSARGPDPVRGAAAATRITASVGTLRPDGAGLAGPGALAQW